MTPWFERTGWIDTYGHLRRDILLQMTQLPTRQTQRAGFLLGTLTSRPGRSMSENVPIRSSPEAETRISSILRTVDSVFTRCEDTVRATPHPFLCWLRSRFLDQAYKAPFQLVLRDSTRRRYRRLWKRCLAFCLRYSRLSYVQQSMLGVPVTREQHACLQEMWHQTDLVDLVDKASEDDPDCDQDDKYSEDEDEIDDEEEDDDYLSEEEDCSYMPLEAVISSPSPTSDLNSVTRQPSLSDLVFQFSLLLCTQEYSNGRPSSSVLVFLSGIFGFTPGGQGYHRPRTYTQTLAALIHQQTLLLLESVLPIYGYPQLGISARPSQGQLSILQAMRRQYICAGCLTPIQECISLLQFGRQFLGSEGAAFFFQWSDDGQTLSFQGHHLRLSLFRQFAQSLVSEASELCHQLMGGWSPPYDLRNVRDLISCSTPGYSFVQDPRNDLQGAYLHLSSRICQEGPCPLIQNNQWVQTAVWKYLRLHEAFLVLLFQIFFVHGGQCPRTPDLSRLGAWNRSTALRGIYIYAGSICTIYRAAKSQRITGREFHVARFFPPAVNKLIYYYLVFIRPLVDLLLRRALGHRTTSSLFASNPFIAQQPLPRHWSTNDLTRWLRKSSQAVLKVPLGVQLYRQITTAMTEKHLRHVIQPTDLYCDVGPHADANRALVWQSGHRPLQRAANYGIDVDFPEKLQPALLERYRQASQQWHEFLTPLPPSERRPLRDLGENVPQHPRLPTITPSHPPKLLSPHPIDLTTPAAYLDLRLTLPRNPSVNILPSTRNQIISDTPSQLDPYLYNE
ncbi:hypothetical protein A1O1_08777, partial [Capronia coronata CBS 617.96]